MTKLRDFSSKQKAAFEKLGLHDYKKLPHDRMEFTCPNCLFTLNRSVVQTAKIGYKCMSCQEIKIQQEAGKAGLVLIGDAQGSYKTNPKNYRHYRLPCGHTEDLQVSHVRRNNWKCNECTEQEYVNRCSEVGATFIRFNKKPSYVTYKYDACGHENTSHVSELLSKKRNNRKSQCKVCYAQRLHERLEKFGITLISKKSSVLVGKFDKCNHKKTFSVGHLMSSCVECKECIYETLEEEARDQDCTFIRIPVLGAGKNLYKLPCGCSKSLRREHFCERRWACYKCGIHAYSKPSNVYLLKIEQDGFMWLKLGFSHDVEYRVKQYGLSNTSKVSVVCSRYFKSGGDAHWLEVSAHRLLSGNRLDKNVMQEFHTKGGKTECYPVLLESTLSKIISGGSIEYE